MYRTNPYRWWNVLAFAAVITVNVLSNALPLGGRTTGEISDRYYIYMTPAGYAFGIWFLIYALLAGFVIYQLRRDTGTRDSVRSIGIWFTLSCIFNMAWLFLWHYLYIEWSVGAMLLLLLSLGIIYRKTRAVHYPTAGETWLLKLPFSIYLGWVCAAFLVNVGIAIHKKRLVAPRPIGARMEFGPALRRGRAVDPDQLSLPRQRAPARICLGLHRHRRGTPGRGQNHAGLVYSGGRSVYLRPMAAFRPQPGAGLA
ncbi:hypothetical protein [Paenibacillus sp. DMB20]|uniref:hypothetical protein n=1 Tax=Paenibacillus sp. DMB20 TaxID=1642570 RepID=UPI000AA52760